MIFAIASKGELFFLDLTGDATFLVDEEAGASGASVTAFCTGVVIFNGETFEARKSLSTLLIMESVWENLCHNLNTNIGREHHPP